jgi:hypothetical protein
VYLAREIQAYQKGIPVDLQKLIIIYNSPQGYALEAFKVSMLILWKNFSGLMFLATVKTNASNIGRTDDLGRTDYFVNKCCQIFYWCNEYIYI